MCSQFWKGHHSCHGALIYPRVYWYTLASKAPLSVHGICTLWRHLWKAHALWYKGLYPTNILWLLLVCERFLLQIQSHIIYLPIIVAATPHPAITQERRQVGEATQDDVSQHCESEVPYSYSPRCLQLSFLYVSASYFWNTSRNPGTYQNCWSSHALIDNICTQHGRLVSCFKLGFA